MSSKLIAPVINPKGRLHISFQLVNFVMTSNTQVLASSFKISTDDDEANPEVELDVEELDEDEDDLDLDGDDDDKKDEAEDDDDDAFGVGEV